MYIQFDASHLEEGRVAALVREITDSAEDWGALRLVVGFDDKAPGVELGDGVELSDGRTYEVFSIDKTGRVVLDLLDEIGG